MKSGVLGKVVGRLRQGLLIQEILDRMADSGLVFYPYRVYVKQLGAGDPSDPSGRTGFEDHVFRELTRTDLPAMSELLLREVPIDHLRQRFDAGHTGYGVFHRGSLVAYTCVARDVCFGAKRSVLFELAPDEAYGFDTFVSRPYRRSGLHAFMLQRCFAVLRDLGVERHYGYVPQFNRVARVAAEKLGYSEIDRRIFLRCFGRMECNPRIGSGKRARAADGRCGASGGAARCR